MYRRQVPSLHVLHVGLQGLRQCKSAQGCMQVTNSDTGVSVSTHNLVEKGFTVKV